MASSDGSGLFLGLTAAERRRRQGAPRAATHRLNSQARPQKFAVAAEREFADAAARKNDR